MKVLICGWQRITGVSDKSGQPKPYDMSRLICLVGIEPRSGENYSFNGGGFETAELDCAPEVHEKLKGKKFPFEAETVTSDEIRYGRLQTRIVDVV